MRRSNKKRQSWLLAGIILLVLGFIIPIPYYIEAPGSAVHLNELVKVNSLSDEEAGSYMLTTVSIQQATPITFFTQYLPFHEGLTEQELLGSASKNKEEYNNLQRYYMSSSINAAIEMAFQAAGEEYQMTYNGIYVQSILEGSNFDQGLQVGDTIVALDGTTFDSSEEFMDFVRNQEIGQVVEVTYQRNGETGTTSAPLMEMPETNLPGLGISLVDDTSIKTDIPVSIDADRIGGPSAGFMFALQIYTQLTGDDLRNGLEIAGTGTISSDGTIGRIGGVEKKVVAASEEGATIFFAPDDEIDPDISKRYPEMRSNYEEALAAAEEIDTNMEIIPVQTFQDAIDYLEGLN